MKAWKIFAYAGTKAGRLLGRILAANERQARERAADCWPREKIGAVRLVKGEKP